MSCAFDAWPRWVQFRRIQVVSGRCASNRGEKNQDETKTRMHKQTTCMRMLRCRDDMNALHNCGTKLSEAACMQCDEKEHIISIQEFN